MRRVDLEFLDFGKYNFYIWTSYAVTFFVLVLNVVLPLMAKKKILKKIKRQNYLNNIELNTNE